MGWRWRSWGESRPCDRSWARRIRTSKSGMAFEARIPQTAGSARPLGLYFGGPCGLMGGKLAVEMSCGLAVGGVADRCTAH